MQDEMPRPIFVVGSPRSGTSILTWCVGHHPNIFPVPESVWMGEFAIDVAVAYQIGSGREDYSTLSAMEIKDAELLSNIGESINKLMLRHRRDLELRRQARISHLRIEPSWLEAASMAAGPKTRWVDGTPEYSFHIWGLLKLFPGARFIHLVRDVSDVVRSMVNFYRVTGIRLVSSEQEAYQYWTRAVKACLAAESACGPKVIRRVLYADLTRNPGLTMRSLLEFLDEPFHERCLEPLQQRINSSGVDPNVQVADPATDPAIVSEATQLFTTIVNTPQPAETSPEAAQSLEADFWRRVNYKASLDREYQKARREIQQLRKLSPELVVASQSSGGTHLNTGPLLPGPS